MPTVDEWVLAFIRIMFRTIFELLRAGTDKTKQEEALMTHYEEVKRELDRRKFSDDESKASISER